MAEIDKAGELIAYLKSLGFEGDLLEDNIMKQCQEFQKSFQIEHRVAFGDELMRYRLRFAYDRQFQAYRITGYEATHRNHVDLDHKQIDGIDTADLERRISAIDWKEHFDSHGFKSNADSNKKRPMATDSGWRFRWKGYPKHPDIPILA